MLLQHRSYVRVCVVACMHGGHLPPAVKLIRTITVWLRRSHRYMGFRYGCRQAAKLLDLVRASITFDSIEDVLWCFRVLREVRGKCRCLKGRCFSKSLSVGFPHSVREANQVNKTTHSASILPHAPCL